MAIDRRGFLFASAALFSATGLGGCAGLVSPIQPICPNDPSTTDPDDAADDRRPHACLQWFRPAGQSLHAGYTATSPTSAKFYRNWVGRPRLPEGGNRRTAKDPVSRPADCRAGMFSSLSNNIARNNIRPDMTALNRAADAVERKSRSAVATEAIRQIRELPQGHARI